MRGGTAESRVVPLRKKSDIREGRGQQGGGGRGGAVGYTCRKYAGRNDQKGEGGLLCVCVCASVDGLKASQPGGLGWRGRGQRGKIARSVEKEAVDDQENASCNSNQQLKM